MEDLVKKIVSRPNNRNNNGPEMEPPGTSQVRRAQEALKLEAATEKARSGRFEEN